MEDVGEKELGFMWVYFKGRCRFSIAYVDMYICRSWYVILF